MSSISPACDANPLHDPSYLLLVVETIADSLQEHSFTSIHDLLDAYATFANRVRSQSQVLDACNALLPAIAPLKIHKDTFIRALRRDVCLAHIDPLLALSRHRFSLDDSLLGSNMHLNIGGDAKQYTRDSSSLCHYALCALTTILRFPAFYFVFPEHDLSLLFGDVLDIALSEQLPVLNEAKIYSLSLWTLSSHRLPPTVLGSRRNDIFSALQQSLDGTRQPASIVLDGLKAISHMIERHPSGFFDLLFPLLPCVMTNLHCESPDLRLHACIALGKFASALIHQSEFSLMKWQRLSNYITSYLESCCDESQVTLGNASLSRIVRTAFSAESHPCPRVTPAWTLAVLASLIVLCGPALYTKPTVLRFIFQTLAMALTHKRSIVRALHPHVWRCFVWTFGRMLFNFEDVESGLISSAFNVIKQEVSGGIGMALTNVLLSDRITAVRSDGRGDRVSQALSVVKAMIRTQCKHTRREGFMFLQAFTNVAQARHQIVQIMYEIPASALLNGTIAGAEWDNLPLVIDSIPKVPVSVHWLEDTEIAQHHKTLLLMWKHFAAEADRKDLDLSLVDVWLSILVACSHQLEYGQHSTLTTDVLGYTTATIVEFLPSVAFADCQPDWGSWDLRDQRCTLTFIDQLWSAMRKAFVTLNLAEAAELILASILKYAFHVLDVGVRTLWSRLCANLMTTASPSFLRDKHDQTASQLVIKSQRELWGVVATSLSPPGSGLDWKELVNLLSIPICTWVLSKPELGAWEALLRSAVTLSGDSAIVIEHLVLEHFRRKQIETWESIMPVLVFLLTCTHEHGNSPSNDFLSIVDGCLTVSYTRAGHSPEVMIHSLELLNVIRHVITSASGNVMHIVQALCSSLCLWIEDRNKVMSNDEFNSVAASLYCETLEVLKVLPLSIQSLRDMEIFIFSAFSRIPTPATALFAFGNFWKATYHGHRQFCGILPPKIKSCLACFLAAHGGDLADGLSFASESQVQSTADDSFASLSANTGSFCLKSNCSQLHLPTSHQCQYFGEISPRASPLSTSIEAGTGGEVYDMEVTLHRQQQTITGQEDTTLLTPFYSSDTLQPIALRQLREYSSRIDASSPDATERSIGSPRILFPSSGAISSAHSSENNHSVTSYVLHRKRKLTDSDDAPKKHGRISQDALRSARKSESEPATRQVTPIHVPRMNSVPLERKVFDGVEVPTLRTVPRQKTVQRVETSKSILSTGQGFVSIPQAPSPPSVHRERTLPSTLSPSVASSTENLDWENFRVDSTSSEIYLDRTSAPHERDDKFYLPSGLSLSEVVSQRGDSPLAPARLSLRRAKTTSARLDALRDVYASVANGASQIPMSELVQATKLVHRIGAALTEEMGKKMGDLG